MLYPEAAQLTPIFDVDVFTPFDNRVINELNSAFHDPKLNKLRASLFPALLDPLLDAFLKAFFYVFLG